jgi:lysozyme family protein
MARENFDRALRLVLLHEGGFVDHPRDPGGATNLGVTLATYSRWIGRQATKAELRRLTPRDVAPIYRKGFWDAVRADDLPSGLDYATFDYAVNSGPGRANQELQKVTHLPVAKAIDRLCASRLSFMQRLRHWATFGRGWSRRVKDVRTTALKWASEKTNAS